MYDNDNYKKLYIEPLLNIKNNLSIINDNISYKYLSKSHIYCKLNEDEIPDILDLYLKKYLKYFIKKPINRYHIEEKHREYNEFIKNNKIFISNI